MGTVFEGLSDPSSLEDLIVEDSETGFTLSAPDDSPAGVWLQYWSSREEEFSRLFTDMLRSYIELANGQTEGVQDEAEREAAGGTRGEEDPSGNLEAHHPLCDI